MFKGIDKALRNNLEVDIFRSGGGLRVVRIEDYKKLKGYGEHPNLKDALRKASKNYLKRSWFNTHYLTGSLTPESQLDKWILMGRELHARLVDGLIKFEARTYLSKVVLSVYAETFKEAYETLNNKLTNELIQTVFF